MKDYAQSAKNGITRRTFLNQSASMVAGASALGASAFSYTRILGSNERVSLGHIGVGNRGRELEGVVSRLKDQFNVEMTAVCDLWKVNREKAVAGAEKVYGRAPRAFQYMEDLLKSERRRRGHHFDG